MPDRDRTDAPICDREGCDATATGYDAWGRWCEEHNGLAPEGGSTDAFGSDTPKYEVVVCFFTEQEAYDHFWRSFMLPQGSQWAQLVRVATTNGEREVIDSRTGWSAA